MSDRNLYRLFGFLSVASISWLGWNIGNPGTDIPGCLFRYVTGIPCPSCGITHSMMDILQFRFTDAIQDNILGFPATAMLAIVSLLIITDLVFRKNYFVNCYRKMEFVLQRNNLLAGFLVALVALNWAYLIMQQ